MPEPNEKVTLVCLFHDTEYAEAAVQDLVAEGVAQADIFKIGNHVGTAAEGSELGKQIARFHLPQSDVDMLIEGLDNGGTLVAVETSGYRSGLVEAVFARHQATEVDEKRIYGTLPAPLFASETIAGEQVFPVAGEDLLVETCEAEAGRSRVFTRVVGNPVTLSIPETTNRTGRGDDNEIGSAQIGQKPRV